MVYPPEIPKECFGRNPRGFFFFFFLIGVEKFFLNGNVG